MERSLDAGRAGFSPDPPGRYARGWRVCANVTTRRRKSRDAEILRALEGLGVVDGDVGHSGGILH